MFKHLKKSVILLLFVAPMLAFFGLAPVHTAAAASDPIRLLQQYLTQLRVSVEVQSEITSQFQEALNRGADPDQMGELVRQLARERVSAENMKQLGETMREIAKDGAPNIVGLINSFNAHLQEGMKAGKALDEALREAKDQAEREQKQLQEQNKHEQEHDNDDVERHEDDGNHEKEGSGGNNN